MPVTLETTHDDVRSVQAAPTQPSRNPYASAVDAHVPEWTKACYDAFQIAAGINPSGVRALTGRRVLRLVANGFALATTLNRSENNQLHGIVARYVRGPLVLWRMSLDAQGIPVRRRLRRSNAMVLAAATVARWLAESTDAQTDGALEDLARHVRFIGRRLRSGPIVTAWFACAEAEVAMLARDSTMAERARRRLATTCASANSFMVRGNGCSLSIDPDLLFFEPMARVYSLFAWPELERPLRDRIKRYLALIHDSHADESLFTMLCTPALAASACEMLAPVMDQAKVLAHVCRASIAERPQSTTRGFEAISHVALAAACNHYCGSISQPHRAMEAAWHVVDRLAVRHTGRISVAVDLHGGNVAAIWPPTNGGPAHRVFAGAPVLHQRDRGQPFRANRKAADAQQVGQDGTITVRCEILDERGLRPRRRKPFPGIGTRSTAAYTLCRWVRSTCTRFSGKRQPERFSRTVTLKDDRLLIGDRVEANSGKRVLRATQIGTDVPSYLAHLSTSSAELSDRKECRVCEDDRTFGEALNATSPPFVL